MLANGNGKPSICAQNLLKCTIGEVPYCRNKGINPLVIGSPMSGTAALKQNARRLIESCEPRVRVGDIAVAGNAEGEFSVTASVTSLEG